MEALGPEHSAAIGMMAFDPCRGFVEQSAVQVGEGNVRRERAPVRRKAQATGGSFALRGQRTQGIALAHSCPDGGRFPPAEPSHAFQ